jgi:hypothetical protein
MSPHVLIDASILNTLWILDEVSLPHRSSIEFRSWLIRARGQLAALRDNLSYEKTCRNLEEC